MKKLNIKSVILTIMLMVSILSSCTKEKEKEKANSKFVGTYIGTANCDGDIGNETIPIEAAPDPASIKIYLNSFHVINGTVSGNTISIPVQNFPSGSENYRFSGSGTLSGNALNLTVFVLYSSVDPDYSYTCVFTLSK